MKTKRFVKDIAEVSLGAAIMPTYSQSIDAAGMGNIGKAAKDIGMLGFTMKAGKKFKVI